MRMIDLEFKTLILLYTFVKMKERQSIILFLYWLYF